MADLDRIKNNVAKMASMNAPEEDIDGYIASEGVTVDDVRNHVINKTWIQKNTTLPQIGQRIKAAADEASAGVESYQQRLKAGEISRVREILGGASEGASLLGTVADEAIGAVGAGAGKVANMISPETFNKIKSAASNASQSELAKIGSALLQKGGDAWSWFEKTYPEVSDIVKDTANVALFAAPVPKSGTGPLVKSNMAGAVEKAAKTQIANKERKFLEELVLPEQTKNARVSQLVEGRTVQKGGVNAPIEVELSKSQKELADAVSTVKGVSPKNTLTGNMNLIDAEISKEAKELQKNLDNFSQIQIDAKDVQTIFTDADNMLLDRPSISKYVRKTLYTKAVKIISSHPNTPSGLLAARKEFDQYIKSFGSDPFDENVRGSINAVSKAVRKGMNGLLEAKIPNQGVRESLQRQARLFDAVDNIASKAAMEKSTRFSRTIERLRNLAPFKTDAANVAALVTLGTGTYFAAPLVGTGIALYVGGKAITSAQAKKLMVPVLRGIDKSIQTATDPDVIKQLRMDRLFIIDTMNEMEKQEKQMQE